MSDGDQSEDLRARGAPRQAQQQMRGELIARLEALAAEVDRTRADKGFIGLLVGMAKLWRYSILNHVMILFQRPSATAVAGVRQWEAMGRTLKEGEQGLIITAPSSPGRFVWVEVYDIDQTEGPPPPVFRTVKGECAHIEAIEAAAQRFGIELLELPETGPVSQAGIPGSVLGCSVGGRIYVRPGLTPLTRARTLVHEYAHELLHQNRFLEKRQYKKKKRLPPKPPHAVAEAEADAAAYVVMEHYGYEIETPTYLAWMGSQGETIMSSLKRIHAAAQAILFAIEGEKRRVVIPWWKKPRPGPGSRSLSR